ncbi:hypothetical protein [Aeromonas hydrophila]|uniref:hypothetical protein n=1 Tax=Aeromonas hydrophila TaxID=644 RepID=UPI00114D24DE|nr:hypothetical protein [Aeromonas hydrophila]
MTVPHKPFWLSQANSEFGGNGWASNILSKASLPLPCWAGELGGKSAAATFNIVIAEWMVGRADYEVGFQPGRGSVSPDNYKGVDFEALFGTSYDDNLCVKFGGAVPNISLTIVGAGTVTVPANRGEAYVFIQWPGIYDWLEARVGQTVQVLVSG